MSLRGILRFIKSRLIEFLIICLLITIMPNLPPKAKFETAYNVTRPRPYEGKLALNNRLSGLEIIYNNKLNGPEGLAVYNGELYTTVRDGSVVKIVDDQIIPVAKFGGPCKGAYQEKLCGRPLGLVFDKSGSFYVADAYFGIYKVDVKTGKKLQLVSVNHQIGGKKPKTPNSIALAANGDLFWSDSSTEFDLQNGAFDMLADGSGRLIHYDAKTKQNTVLIDGLHFANGVFLAQDESFVVVAETARNRLMRHYLKGPKQGTTDIFIDGLPGMPDNLRADGRGGLFVPLVLAVDADHVVISQVLGPFPYVRKFLARIQGLFELAFHLLDQVYPLEFAEKAVHYIGHFESIRPFLRLERASVLHLSQNGEILDSIHTDSMSGLCDVIFFNGYLYLGSPFNAFLTRIPLAQVGWSHLAPPTEPTSASAKSAPTATPKPTTATPKATPSTTPKPAPTTTTPKPTTTTPKATPTTPKPKPTTTTSKPPTTTPQPTKTPKPVASTTKTTTPPPKPSETTKSPPPATKSSKPTAKNEL